MCEIQIRPAVVIARPRLRGGAGQGDARAVALHPDRERMAAWKDWRIDRKLATFTNS